MFNGQWSMVNGQCLMVNGQCLMVNVQSFYCCQIRGPRGLRASKYPRALGKFFSLTGAQLFSFVLTMQRYKKYASLSRKYPKNSHFWGVFFGLKMQKNKCAIKDIEKHDLGLWDVGLWDVLVFFKNGGKLNILLYIL